MKSYALLDCKDMKSMSTAIYFFILKEFQQFPLDDGWFFIDAKKLLNYYTPLMDFFKEHKLIVRDAAFTVAKDNNSLRIHVDQPPVIAKLNIPVANTDGWANRWYHVEEEKLKSCGTIKNKFGADVPNLQVLDKNEFILIDEVVNLSSPIIFNSSIPHSVEMISEIKQPRIVASFTFFNEPLSYLIGDNK